MKSTPSTDGLFKFQLRLDFGFLSLGERGPLSLETWWPGFPGFSRRKRTARKAAVSIFLRREFFGVFPFLEKSFLEYIWWIFWDMRVTIVSHFWGYWGDGFFSWHFSLYPKLKIYHKWFWCGILCKYSHIQHLMGCANSAMWTISWCRPGSLPQNPVAISTNDA